MLKPGSQEPWTPYRLFSAFVEAGIPAEVFGLYPGGHDAGGAVLSTCQRAMIFGGASTVEQYHGNPRVQVHGPGFSKILLGDDVVDDWEQYLDLMVESIFANGGRSCINSSGVWASRHTEAIAQAWPNGSDRSKSNRRTIQMPPWRRSRSPGWDVRLADDRDRSARAGGQGYDVAVRAAAGRVRALCVPAPVIAHCNSPDRAIAQKEYMFPFAAVVQCPQAEMVARIGPTLVCTCITRDEKLIRDLSDATHVDRLNIGRIPTTRLNWLQPHEGNLIDFLFRSRAYQVQEG